MAYQTLYRKYRPKTFDLVFGQKVIVNTLLNIINNKKLSHAYLFTGPRGTGKTSSAKLFAKAVNCLNNKDGDACNECQNCISFNNNENPDIIEIDAASNNGVDEIREIRNNVNLVPSISKYKIYIIDEVHMLSIGAFNALLKTLEEPPEYIIFILATTEPQKIPETIISRCQRFDFKYISNNEMKKCLKNIITKENIKIDEDAIDEIINNSRGGMRDAIGLLDQAYAFCTNNITKTDVENLSGNISENKIYNFINNIKDNKLDEMLKFSDEIYDTGKDYELVVGKIINVLRNELILYKVSKQCKIDISDTKIIKLIEQMEQLYEKINKYSNKKLIFDVDIIRIYDILNKSNVSRETLDENINIDNNLANEIPMESTKEKNNVSRETLLDNEEKKNSIFINNILLTANKKYLIDIKNKFYDIDSFLVDENYKLAAGLLHNSEPVAASLTDGIIISVEDEVKYKRVLQKKQAVNELIYKIFNENNINIGYISKNKWQNERIKYIEKIKNNELKRIEYNENNNLLDNFNEFIEMEEK